MQKLNTFIIALAFLGVSATANAQTSGSCGDNLTWTLTGAGSNLTLAISGTGNMKNYDSAPHTAPWYTQRANITTLVLPNGITAIGSFAFYACSSLKGTLIIPDSVTYIGEGAFSGCSGLTAVNYNATNCTTMGSSLYPVFTNCTQLATLNIGENVKSIPDYAFFQCSNLSGTLTIPDSLASIGNMAFANCSSVAVLTIGSSVKTIGDNAFYMCYGIKGTLTIPDSITSIGIGAFYSCWGLTTVNFNATNCTTMGRYGNDVFHFCRYIATLNIGKNVKIIPDASFISCNITGTLTIPDSVISIGNYAFAACNNVTELTIGKNVAFVGDSAFLACSNIATINSLRDVPPVAALGTKAFQGVPDSIPVNIPCGMKTYYENDPDWSSAFSNFHEAGSYTITVESNDDDMGTAGVTQQPTCTNNQATIQAVANSGCQFTKWSDNNTDNPRTVMLSSDTTLTAIFEVASGINEIRLGNISIYPNPVKNELIIENGQLTIINVEITDLAGRNLTPNLSPQERGEFPSSGGVRGGLTINVSSLPTGVYLVKINTDKGVVARKVVKD